MALCLLDTDILSEILKRKHPRVIPRATAYLAQYGRFAFSLISRYEILRGLKAKNATAQLGAFQNFCQHSDVLPITDDIVVTAADLYAHLRQQGQLISDADLLIAATALHHGRILVTGNTAHFQRIPGLGIEDWTM